MLSNIEQHLDKIFPTHDLVNKCYEYIQHKDTNWKIQKRRPFVRRGRCVIIAVRYNSTLDCEMYTIRDIDTGEVYTVSVFDIDFFELK